MGIPVFDIDGVKVEETVVLGSVTSANPDHVLYLVKKYQDSLLHQGTSSTLTKGEVSGGGAKPYKQKGTGRARRGSNRSPLIRGGGIAFGPKPRSFAISINSKTVKLAYAIAYSQNLSKIVILRHALVNSLKTKEANALMKKIVGNSIGGLFVLGAQDADFELGIRNLKGIRIRDILSVSIEDLYLATSICVSEDVFLSIKGRYFDGRA
jgi:large subunit ribosomal protein L4